MSQALRGQEIEMRVEFLCYSSEFRQFREARFFLQNLVLKSCYDSLCRELDFPDEIVEKISEAAKMSIRLQKYKSRRME
jgi:hypothetical protein